MQDFINTLSDKDKKKVNVVIDYLKERGIELRRPHSDYLRSGIHELRIKLERGTTRTLYFFCYENYIILTHAFYKRTDAVPENEISKALDCKIEIMQKYTKENINEL
jgi:phage-related protein